MYVHVLVLVLTIATEKQASGTEGSVDQQRREMDDRAAGATRLLINDYITTRQNYLDCILYTHPGQG